MEDVISTPIGHTLSGVAAYSCQEGKRRFDAGLMLGAVVMANLPDVDYFFGFLSGRPNAFHHGPTHSVFFVILVGLAAGFMFGRYRRRGFRRCALLFLTAGLLHLLVDYFTLDRAFPYGAQLFWPVSEAYFLSPVTVFRDVVKGGTNVEFLKSVFHPHNLVTGLTELAVFAPITAIAFWLGRKDRRRSRHGIQENDND